MLDSLIRPSTLRIGLAFAALVAASGAAWIAHTDARDRQNLTSHATELGIDGGRLRLLRSQLAREPDAGERKIALGRILLGSGEGVGRALRLESAATLGAEALATLPASWEAALLVGAARFNLRLLHKDSRLFSAARQWEEPLLAAVERSHGTAAVEQALAAAYLEVWPALSAKKRPQAAELLRRSLQNPSFRERHLELWFARSGSLEQAAELLPVDAESDRNLAWVAWRRGDAGAAARYSQSARARLLDQLESSLSLATAGGVEPAESGRPTALLETAPLGRDFAPLVERALAARTRGPISQKLAQAADTWLRWAEPLCLVTDCPFSTTAFQQLLSVSSSQLGSPSIALALLAGGERSKADQLAQSSKALSNEAWVPYLLLAAKLDFEAGDLVSARKLLLRVHPAHFARPTCAALLRATTSTASAMGQLADLDLVNFLERESWRPTDWVAAYGHVGLELGIARSSSALVVSFRQPLSTDLLLRWELDGNVSEPLLVAAGAQAVRLPLQMPPGIHLLRLVPVFGNLPSPGETTLQ